MPGELKDRAREDARTDLLPWFGDWEVENKFVGFLRVPGVEPWGTLRILFGKIGEPNREDERGITTSH